MGDIIPNALTQDSVQARRDGRARQLIRGAPGVSKSHIAQFYAERYADHYSALLLVAARSPESLRLGLAALCAEAVLCLPERVQPSTDARADAAVRWLRTHRGWLLVLDNADTDEARAAVSALVGRLEAGHVLVTTRRDDWGEGYESHWVDVPDAADAAEFLLARTAASRKRTPTDRADADALYRQLGGVGLVRAAEVIRTARLSFAEYGGRLAAAGERVAAFRPANAYYTPTLAANWLTAADALSADGRALFDALAWFAADPLPAAALGPAPDGTGGTAVEELARFALLFRRTTRTEVDLSQAVQQAARDGMTPAERDRSLRRVIDLLERATAAVPAGDPDRAGELAALTPHARAVVEHAVAAGLGDLVARLAARLPKVNESDTQSPETRAEAIPPSLDGATATEPEATERDKFEDGLQTLTGTERLVFDLHFHLQMPQSEIADLLGMTRKAVSRSWLVIAMKLKGVLSDKGGEAGTDLPPRLVGAESIPTAEWMRAAVRRLLDLTKAVVELHGRSVIHGDLHPANILVEEGNRSGPLLDFVTGQRFEGGRLRATLREPTHQRVALVHRLPPGTQHAYSSPQQLAGARPTPLDDVYALGVVGYQLLMRRFGDGPGFDVLEEMTDAGVDPALALLIVRCCSHDPGRRPRDAVALLAELSAIAAADARPAEPPPSAPEPPAPLPYRRLPIYLVLDCSGSMSGEPLEAVRAGLTALVADLRGDPQALESGYLSVITFGSDARQLCPLTDLMAFAVPEFDAGGATALGAALRVLERALDTEVWTATATRKGDWRPVVFLLTDGQPTDDWQEVADRLKARRLGTVIACAAGPFADVGVLRRITDTVVKLDSLQPDTFRQFFRWVSDSVRLTSTSVQVTAAPGSVRLPPYPPPAVEIIP